MVPIVQIGMFEGRTVEQKRAMVEGITEAIVKSVDCKPEAVRIIIRDIAKHNVGHAGKLVCDLEDS